MKNSALETGSVATGDNFAATNWRHKKQGDLNYEALLVNVSKQNQPNMVRDAYIRDYHRKQDVTRYFEDLRSEKDRERSSKQRRKEEELDWEKRYISKEVNIFQANLQREKEQREEQKKRYAEDLKRQMQLEQEEKLNRNRMTKTEKRINHDNLQVLPCDAGLQVLGPQQLR